MIVCGIWGKESSNGKLNLQREISVECERGGERGNWAGVVSVEGGGGKLRFYPLSLRGTFCIALARI